jgi:hypothetical protein
MLRMGSYWSSMPRISTDFQYRGIDAVLMENESLRITLLPGKGGDILEFRDKHTDIDILWHAQHNWQSPAETYIPSTPVDNWMAYWPGGWQVNLPLAGWGGEVSGTSYESHGESALMPWDADIEAETADEVSLQLSVELANYPLYIERELTLPKKEGALQIQESITNRGQIDLEYIWQQHIALGPPLISPEARLDLPAASGMVDPSYGDDNTFATGRLSGGEDFDWPYAPAADGGTVDLRRFPPQDADLHDQVYALDLEDGWYGVTNTDLDLGFGLRFPTDPFECVWYWQPFGGFRGSPFFKRNYNVGLEPTSAYPAGNIPEAQRENGTMKTLQPNETVTADLTAVTYYGLESVSDIVSDGTVIGREL